MRAAHLHGSDRVSLSRYFHCLGLEASALFTTSFRGDQTAAQTQQATDQRRLGSALPYDRRRASTDRGPPVGRIPPGITASLNPNVPPHSVLLEKRVHPIDSPPRGGSMLRMSSRSTTADAPFPAAEGPMFSIGDFSKVTGLTVKTLRYYHEQGLLIPTHVDDETGYRYYDRAKIETARVISHLRSLDLSIEEIRQILRGAVDDAELRAVFERQKKLLESRIEHDREIVRVINTFLAQELETERIMAQASFQVEEKRIDPLRIAGIRVKGRYSDCGGAFARIGKRFGRYIRGKPMLLHYDCEYREDDADFEACMPVKGGSDTDGITTRDLAGGQLRVIVARWTVRSARAVVCQDPGIHSRQRL